MRLPCATTATSIITSTAIVILLAVVCSSWTSADEAPAVVDDSKDSQQADSATTVDQARQQAAALHTVLHATLQQTHDRYYREDEGLPIPAAVMQDVFVELQRQHNIRARWLVVEGQAMNTDHLPQSDFELAAVKTLKAGKLNHEQVVDGIYRRAAGITLSNHCLKCHVPDRRNTKDRIAGLVISIPIIHTPAQKKPADLQ
jgi:hypothetical protein